MKKMITAICFIAIISGIGAQVETTSPGYNSASIYLYSGTLAGSEQLKIKTYIWGQVKKPGLYIVPDNTDLITLISSAGGPTEVAKLAKVRIVRSTVEGEKIIFVDLKKYLKTGDYDLIPVLQPGDTVVISGTIFYAFTKIAEFLSDIAIIFSVYSTISGLQ